MTAAIQVDRLTITLASGTGRALVRDVSFEVAKGQVVGLIGESGAGKSTTARSLLGMYPPGSKVDGTVRVGGIEVTALSRTQLQRFRSQRIAMVAQDPRASVNPLRKLSDFLLEALRADGRVSASGARDRVITALRQVALDPDKIMSSYPHQVSGGMLQRVVIAAGLAVHPDFLVADEPTTALDVTSQAEIMGVLRRLVREMELTLVLVTHNIELAAAICDRMVVMRNGEIVEQGLSENIMRRPAMPYTGQLIEATQAVSLGTARGDFPGFSGGVA